MAIRERKLEPGDEGSGNTPPPSTPIQPTRLSPFRRALDDYTDGLQTAWRPELASTRLNDVWRTVGGAATATATDYASLLEHQAQLARKLQDAWLPPDVQSRFEALFTDYVNRTKAAWAELDAATVTPAELMTIAAIIAQGATFLAVPLQRQQDEARSQSQ